MSQRSFTRAHQKKSQKKQDMSQEQQPSVQAMVWYRKEHWETLKKLFADGEQLPPSYADWLQRAEEMAAEAQRQGDVVLKVYIEPEPFAEWCRNKGCVMNSEARSQLAIEVAQSQSFAL